MTFEFPRHFDPLPFYPEPEPDLVYIKEGLDETDHEWDDFALHFQPDPNAHTLPAGLGAPAAGYFGRVTLDMLPPPMQQIVAARTLQTVANYQFSQKDAQDARFRQHFAQLEQLEQAHGMHVQFETRFRVPDGELATCDFCIIGHYATEHASIRNCAPDAPSTRSLINAGIDTSLLSSAFCNILSGTFAAGDFRYPFAHHDRAFVDAELSILPHSNPRVVLVLGQHARTRVHELFRVDMFQIQFNLPYNWECDMYDVTCTLLRNHHPVVPTRPLRQQATLEFGQCGNAVFVFGPHPERLLHPAEHDWKVASVAWQFCVDYLNGSLASGYYTPPTWKPARIGYEYLPSNRNKQQRINRLISAIDVLCPIPPPDMHMEFVFSATRLDGFSANRFHPHDSLRHVRYAYNKRGNDNQPGRDDILALGRAPTLYEHGARYAGRCLCGLVRSGERWYKGRPLVKYETGHAQGCVGVIPDSVDLRGQLVFLNKKGHVKEVTSVQLEKWLSRV